jgi:hypothetical protein
MRETKEQSPRPKPKERRDKTQEKTNKRLAEQTRKILGKHYASKDRVTRDRCA